MADPQLQKTYLYKTYRSGVFLGCLPVKSVFGFNQTVNSSGPKQITLTLAQSADVSGQIPDPILDEDGNPILDEDGNQILAESATEVVGNSNSRILARNGNAVKIYEYSERYPNGICVYNGKIKNWKGTWGGEGDIELIVYPDGTELDNSPLVGDSYSSDQSQTSDDSDLNTISANSKGSGFAACGQSFQVGAGITNIAAIDIKVDTFNIEREITVRLFRDINDFKDPIFAGSPSLATATRVITADGDTVFRYTFSTPIEVTEGETLYFRTDITEGNAIVRFQTTNVYANGTRYYVNYGGAGGSADLAATTGDLYFVTYDYGGETTAVFDDADPVSEIIKTPMDNYISDGGSIGYDPADLVATGEAIDYTFIGATVFAGITKGLELCPSNYYWTVDAGTNKLSVKPMSETADFIVRKGLHVNKLDLSASIESVKNDIPFSGGIVGGQNLYRRYTDQSSIDEWGRGYNPQSDNRVTVENTMDQLGQTRLQIERDEQYQTTVTLLDATVDITQYKPGKTIGFAGFGAMIDSLVLMIVGIDYAPDRVILSLGSLPPRTVVTLDKIQRDLEAVQTVDNPDAPS